MTNIILLSHNLLSKGLKETIKMITGIDNNVYAFSLMPGDHPSKIYDEVTRICNQSEYVYLLVDIYGGSICNAVLPLTQRENVCLITGMNLPLAIQLLLNPPKNENELNKIIDESQKGIKRVQIKKIYQDLGDSFYE